MTATLAPRDPARRGRPRARRLLATVLAACVATALAACSSSATTRSHTTPPPLPDKVDSIAQMLPEEVAEDGTLLVVAAIYPPAVSQPVDGGPVTGWDIENARQIAAVLGIHLEIQIAPFDAVISGLASNRYDAAVGEIYITPERTEAATFVTNHVSTDTLLVPAESEIESADDVENLCGLILAAQRGSAEADLIRKIATKCEEKGKDRVTAKTFQTQANVNLALSEDRVDAAVSSASQAAHTVDQIKDEFRVVEMPWAPDYDTGFALAHNSHTPQLAKAIRAATDHLIKTGKLQRILDEFNQGQGGIDNSEIVPSLADN